jgi:hypothetical protein
MSASITITNLDRVAGILNPSHLQKLMKAATASAVAVVEAEVKKMTPVRTGHLRRSIHGAVRSVNEGVVGTNLFYAPFVHARNPYLLVGYENSAHQINAILIGLGGRAFEE